MQKSSIAGAVAALVFATAAPAFAVTTSGNPPGTASAGSADFAKGDQTVKVEPLAVCTVDGATTASSPAVSRTGLRIGATSSACTTTVVDPETETTTTRSEAKGTLFELSALVARGGPRLKIGSWKITCDATQTGTSAGWSLGQMSGWTGLPQQIPSGYVHEIKKSNGTVLAKAEFTETVFPVPNDGSLGMTLLKITFEPSSGYTGTITLGTTACSPTP